MSGTHHSNCVANKYKMGEIICMKLMTKDAAKKYAVLSGSNQINDHNQELVFLSVAILLQLFQFVLLVIDRFKRYLMKTQSNVAIQHPIQSKNKYSKNLFSLITKIF